MNAEEFRRLAETWGGDIERWPNDTQTAARRFALTVEGAEVLRQAQDLDGLLGGVLARPNAISEDRVATATFQVIQRIAAEEPRKSWPAAYLPDWRLATASLACSVLLGAILAMSLPYGEATGQKEAAAMLSTILDGGSTVMTW
jgi:hypothetical protein